MPLACITHHCRSAIIACSLITLMSGAQHVQASSADAWEEFQQNVEKACLAAASGLIDAKTVHVDPYGSESYGFAVMVGILKGTSQEGLVACAYDKQSETAEVSGSFDMRGRSEGSILK